ncbi:hypothetical protein [Rhodoblastus sp.]|jgi:hypothetical protein|uniref:hypothetical protein n=1 Tax=Rhodoblastus sp. TaxID=1962975 RepID=UPI0025E15E4A|nr:hypothetical protein [Rhodoblastus sp.]
MTEDDQPRLPPYWAKTPPLGVTVYRPPGVNDDLIAAEEELRRAVRGMTQTGQKVFAEFAFSVRYNFKTAFDYSLGAEARINALNSRIDALSEKLAASLNREARLVRVVAMVEARLATLAENADLDTIENYIDATPGKIPLVVVPETTPIQGN